MLHQSNILKSSCTSLTINAMWHRVWFGCQLLLQTKKICGLLKAVAECHPLNRWVYIDVNLEAFDWSMLHVVGKILLVAGVCILRSFLTF